MAELKYVGKNIIKDDSREKATGKTKYIVDMERTDMLYAKLLLSTEPHANISIDMADAEKVEDIISIYTFKDVPKIKYNSYIWSPGIPAVYDEYLLNDVARYVGDRIAVVVGKSLEAVNEALKKIKVTYEPLEPIIGIENANKDSKNIAFEKEMSCGDINSAFQKEDLLIFEDVGTTQKIHHAAMEPHICLTEKDENNNIVIYSACQGVFQVQTVVSEALDIPFHKIRVIKMVMGGSFGGKGQPILEPICAFITEKLGKPVKLVMDRKDAIQATRTRNASKISVKTAVDKSGKIMSRYVLAEIDGGAYYTNASAMVMSMGKKAFRLYNIEDQTFLGKTYYTNTLLGGGCRGYGSPQIHAITEINIDNIAKNLGMDPCDFRLKNLVNPHEEDPTGGPNFGNAKIRECVEIGMKDFDWYNKRKTIKNQDTDRYSYGVGMACGVHGNGYKGSFPDFTDVNMVVSYDGNIVIKAGVHDQGCGTLITLKQIAAEVLDMDVEKIQLQEADTFLSPYDSAGTQASRVTYVSGGAIKEASEKLVVLIKETFSKLHNVKVEEISFANGIVSSADISYTLGEFAKISQLNFNSRLGIDCHYESPANPGTYAVCFSTVKVDKYTGHVDVLECTAIHDIGKSINPILVEGQVQGGAHFAIGMAIREEISIDSKGYVKSNNFSKYHLLNATEMPYVKVITVEDLEMGGPFGAKSVGEMAAVAPTPAIINAINFALDTNITNYPATPEVIIKALLTKKNKGV